MIRSLPVSKRSCCASSARCETTTNWRTSVRTVRDLFAVRREWRRAQAGAVPGVAAEVGEYARAAKAVIAGVTSRGVLPVVTGGTGFYLGALLDGLPELPARAPSLRENLNARESRRAGALQRLLGRLEPAAARRIHPNDTHKLIRALEVRLLTQAALPPRQPGSGLAGYRVLILGLDPDRRALFELLNQRARDMFEKGLLEEVAALLASGLSGAEKPFESLGYKQALACLRGQMSLAQAMESTQTETRQYAKRQWTWFRRDPRVEWLRGFGTEDAVVQAGLARAREFLEKSFAR